MGSPPNSNPIPAQPESPKDEPLGWFASFGLVFVLLVALRWGVAHIDVPRYQGWTMTAGVAVLMGIPALRRACFRTLVLSIMLAFFVYVAKNHEAIRAGHVSLKHGAMGVAKVLVGFGPVRELARLRDDASYGIYLQAVDHRNPTLNQRATEVARGCGGADSVCVASRIVDYVTSQFEYRSDPVPVLSEGDYVKTPEQTIAAKAGDCDDLTVLTVSMLGTVGIRSYMVFEPGHTYPLACFASRELGDELLRIKGEYCYAAEPTAQGSRLGVAKSASDISAIFDPFNRVRIPLNVKGG